MDKYLVQCLEGIGCKAYLCANINPIHMSTKTEYIDLTPTWQALLPVLVEVAANGATLEGRKSAMAELMTLAKFADEHNANTKTK